MLLGQIVAVSFAWNLFNIAAVCSPIIPERHSQGKEKKRLELTSTFLVLCLAVCFSCIYFVPYTVGSSYFLPVLGIPHILLFVPLYVLGNEDIRRFGGYTSLIFIAAIVCLFAKATQEAYDSSARHGGFVGALYEHPAVSSVGWDVIFCYINFATASVLERWEKA
jgi:hypothetical protein